MESSEAVHSEYDDAGQTPSRSVSSSRNFRSKVVMQRKGKPKQVTILLFHALFKILALALYIGSGAFGMDYISTFVAVAILVSVDFWTTKNISGRLLVGLRWSTTVEDDTGRVKWLYQSWSTEERRSAHVFQARTFWAALWAHQLLWTVLIMAALFSLRLNWFVLTCLVVTLNTTNLCGYLRCRFLSHSEKDDNDDARDRGWLFSLQQIFSSFPSYVRWSGYTRGRRYNEMDVEQNM